MTQPIENTTQPIEFVVLIDDEEIDLVLYTRVLERSGLVQETMTFTDATEALDFLTNHPERRADVILLDINMPGMDGFEFLEVASSTLGSDFATSVIVMLTTSLLAADRERAERYGVVRDFISKPLTTDHVKQIASMLDEAN